jgi:hypothetical protein
MRTLSWLCLPLVTGYSLVRRMPRPLALSGSAPISRQCRQILRLVIVLWGTTAFGVVHVYIENVIIIGFRFSTSNPPPGFGYMIFATITISAILTVIMTLRTPRRVADDEPHQDHHSKSLALG